MLQVTPRPATWGKKTAYASRPTSIAAAAPGRTVPQPSSSRSPINLPVNEQALSRRRGDPEGGPYRRVTKAKQIVLQFSPKTKAVFDMPDPSQALGALQYCLMM
jgi:hypothetical protein